MIQTWYQNLSKGSSFFLFSNATMNIPDVEAFGNKLGPIIIQSEGSSFNTGILLNETNYDMWSQIIEMHITKKRNSHSFVVHRHLQRKKRDTKNDMQIIKKSRDGS